ncbi:hypothetical protein OHA02_51785 [Streptomyces phaeochromogenes]|nr:hypothetical protein [Streptomyces phaeochromogenes]
MDEKEHAELIVEYLAAEWIAVGQALAKGEGEEISLVDPELKSEAMRAAKTLAEQPELLETAHKSISDGYRGGQLPSSKYNEIAAHIHPKSVPLESASGEFPSPPEAITAAAFAASSLSSLTTNIPSSSPTQRRPTVREPSSQRARNNSR